MAMGAEDQFYNDLGDDLDPSLFEFTAGGGYDGSVNSDAGKAIAYPVNAWFFGPLAPYEYIGRIDITLMPGEAVPAGNVIPASTGGWAMGGAGVWVSTIPTTTDLSEYADAEPTGFYFGGGAVEGEEEVVSTVPTADEIVTEGAPFIFCGPGATGNATTSEPAQDVIVAVAGFVMGGVGTWGQVAPADLPSDVLVPTGGWILSGSGFPLDPGVAPTATVIIPTGGWRLGGRRPDPVEVTYPDDLDRVIVSSGGWEFGGNEGALESTIPPATLIESAGAIFLLSGAGLATSKFPPIAVITGDALGGWVLGGPDAVEVYEAWCLNAQSFEPSVFSGFNFNSFCFKGGVAYAAGAAGIYILGGDHDAGEPINSGIRIGPINAGFDGEKRLRSIQFGSGGNGTSVRVRTDDGGEGVFKPDRDSNRVVVSRDLQGREMQIDVMGFEEISQFEMNFLRLARR
jgi:hypothetical protein